jgi:hypothetical protein
MKLGDPGRHFLEADVAEEVVDVVAVLRFVSRAHRQAL